jgi:hypothetical protein
MNQKDLKIRKQWLALTVFLPLLGLVYNGYHFSHDPLMDLLPVWYKYVLISSIVFSPLLFNYALYKCAYKKPGTKLLSILAVLTPVSLAGSIWAYVSGAVPMPNNPLLWSYIWVSHGLGIYWWVLNWKMRSINKRLKARLSERETVPSTH